MQVNVSFFLIFFFFPSYLILLHLTLFPTHDATHDANNHFKAAQGLDLIFFSVTDISPELAEPTSLIFMCGPEEASVSALAFPQGTLFTTVAGEND